MLSTRSAFMERPIFFGSCLAKGGRDKNTIGSMGQILAGTDHWHSTDTPYHCFAFVRPHLTPNGLGFGDFRKFSRPKIWLGPAARPLVYPYPACASILGIVNGRAPYFSLLIVDFLQVPRAYKKEPAALPIAEFRVPLTAAARLSDSESRT